MNFFQGKDGGKDAIKKLKKMYDFIRNAPEPDLKEVAYLFPEMAKQIEDIRLGKTNFEDIQDDPKLSSKVIASMDLLEERAQGGETQSERLTRVMDQESAIATANQDRQNMLRDLLSRGMDTSGAALQSLIAGNQGTANRAAQTSRDRILSGQQRADQATMQLGAMSSAQQNQDFARKSQIASAKDNRDMQQAHLSRQANMANTAAEQAYLNNKTMIQNKNLDQPNLIAQQRYNNTVAKFAPMANVASNEAAMTAKYGSTPSMFSSALQGGMTGGQLGGGWGALIGAGIGMASNSQAAENGAIINSNKINDRDRLMNYLNIKPKFNTGGLVDEERDRVLQQLENSKKQRLDLDPNYYNKPIDGGGFGLDTNQATQDNFDDIRKVTTKTPLSSKNIYAPTPLEYKKVKDDAKDMYDLVKGDKELGYENIQNAQKDLNAVNSEDKNSINNKLQALSNIINPKDGSPKEDNNEVPSLNTVQDVNVQNIMTPIDTQFQTAPAMNAGGLVDEELARQRLLERQKMITPLQDLLNYQEDQGQLAAINEQASSPHQAPVPAPQGQMPMQPPMPPQGMPPQGAPVPVKDGGIIHAEDGLDPNEIYDLEDKYDNIENDLSDPYGHPEMDSIDNDMKVEDEENRMADEANYENGGSFNPEIFLKNQEASKRYQNGGTYRMADGDLTFASDGSGDVVAGDSFERDRVDARLNSGEAVLNVAQQQRLMDLLRGKISLDELGDDDIVEGVPRDYQDDLTSILDMGMSPSEDEEDEDVDIKGLRRLIKMLGKEE